MKRAIKNMEEKWDRLVDVAEGGIANIKTNKKGKNIFGGTEPVTINGIPEWDPKFEVKRRIKEADGATRR